MRKIVVLCCMLLVVNQLTQAQLSGTKTIGPGGDYTTLTAAFADITGSGLSGPVILELQSGYSSVPETFPLTPPVIATAANTITVRPAAGASGLSITTANTTGTVNLNGVSYFILDGRAGGSGSTKDLTVWNTSTSGYDMLFTNGACNNIIRYCTIRGYNSAALGGVIMFTAASATTGNNNNLIDHCDIRDGGDAVNYPVNGISSTGTATRENSNNTVSNCNIYNYYRAGGDMNGVLLNTNSSDWIITGNSFYQTAARNITGNFFLQGIASTGTSVGNLTVSGNYFGGTAPFCGGGAMSITGAGGFKGIRLTVNSSAVASVQGNYIQNISLTSSSNSTAISGISLVGGSFNCGDVSPNIIGSTTAAGNITLVLSNTGPPVFSGIFAASGAVVDLTVANNMIGGIAMSGTGNAGLRGVWVNNGSSVPASMTVSGNTIGYAGAPLTNACAGGTGTVNINGITINSQTAIQTISNNSIQYLSFTGTGTNNQLTGISILPQGAGAGAFNVYGNSITDLTSSSSGTNGGVNCSVIGLLLNASVTPGQAAYNNTIHSLSNTNGTPAVKVTGVYYNGPPSGENYLSGNNIHSLKTSSTSTTSAIYGILMAGGNVTSGSVRIYNNMIRLGIDGSGASITVTPEIAGIFRSAGVLAAYSNTIYVGGSGVGSGSVRTYAYQRNSATTDTLVNNIFVNNRSNATAGSGGKHYACYLTSTTGHYANYNIYQASGNDGVVFTPNSGTTLVNTMQALWAALPGMELNSGIGDPDFVNPAGNSSTVDLHVQSNTPAESCGTNIPGITSDFDGMLRSTLSPEDIGADAGDYSNTNADIFYPFITFDDFCAGAVAPGRTVGEVYITDQGSGVNTASGSRPRIYYKKSGDANTLDYTNDPLVNGWKWVEANNTTSPFEFTINYAYLNSGPVVVGDVIQYFVVAQDQATPVHLGFNPLAGSSGVSVNNLTTIPSTPRSYPIWSSISGVKYIGGATPDYPNLTGTTGLFQDINARVVTGNITAVIAADLSETAIHGLNQWAENDLPAFTLTIQPDGPTLRTITGLNLTTTYMIRFSGADRVTIDGGTSKNLLFRSTHTTPASARSPIQFDNGAVQGTVTNAIIETNSSFGANIHLGNTGRNSVNISYCDLKDATAGTPGAAKQGIYSNNPLNSLNANNNNIYNWTDQGIALVNCANACQVSGNSFYNNQVTPPSGAQTAIQVSNGDHHLINDNYIGGSAPQCGGAAWQNSGTNPFYGISLTADQCNSIIENNTIATIAMTGAASASVCGINVYGATVRKNKVFNLGATNSGLALTVYGIRHNGQAGQSSEFSNNMISLDGGNASDPSLYGFYGDGAPTASVGFFYNSLHITGPVTSTASTYVFYRNTDIGYMVKDNILVNSRLSGGAGKHYAIVPFSTGGPFISDYNVLYSNGPLGYWNLFVQNDFTSWKAATSQDANSINLLPAFTSATDLHLLSANNCFIDGKGTPVAGITSDIDANTRDLVTPDPGCDEFSSVYPANPVTDPNPAGCESDASHSLTATGIGTINWYDDVTLTNQLYSGSPYVTGPLSGGTYTYFVTDSVSGCESPAVTVSLAIDPATEAGSVTPDRQVCSGGNSGLLTLGSHTGSVVRWQYSIAPFSDWTDIPHTGTTYTSGTLTKTTHFRAVVKNGVCNEAYSGHAVITVPAPPAVSFDGTLASQCADATSYTLTGGLPSGGTYSGPGVLSGNFDASLAGTGTHVLTYTYTDANTCKDSATNSITVHALPPVGFNGTLVNQCVSSTTYPLTGGTPAGGSYSGPGVSGTNFDASSAGTGDHTITYTYTDGNTCTDEATNTISVLPVPAVFIVSGTGNYCQGSGGLTINLDGSQTGATYQLYKDLVVVGTPLTGTGGSLSWTGMEQGVYTVTATIATSGCTAAMAGSATLTEDPLPVVYTVSGNGHYCFGESGLTVTLDHTATGVSYQLRKNGVDEDAPQSGGGSALTWTGKTDGTYTVLATVISTGCTQLMAGSAVITEDPQLSAGITPDPAYVITGNSLNLNGNPSGGTVPYTNHAWSGTGATSLSSTTVEDPIFTNTLLGPFPLTYTVTDSHGCNASASLTVTVTSAISPPVMQDQIRCNTGTLVMEAIIGGGGDQVQFSLDGSVVAFTAAAFPFQYTTPVVTVGTGITVYARTYNSISLLSGSWVTASATAYVASIGGSVSGGGNICLGEVIPTLALTGYTGTILRWQKRVNSGSWTDVANVSSSYAETPLSAGSWDYRAEVQIPGCVSVYSDFSTVVVYPLSAGGSLSGGTNEICLGTSTATITLNGYTGTVLQWQKRLNGLAWQPISHTLPAYSEIPSSAGTWEYQAEVRSGSCAAAWSEIYTVVVDPPTVGGAVSGGAAICPAVLTPNLILTGQTGAVIKWQKRLNAGTWADIPVQATTFAEIPSSSGTWDYRAVVQNGVCNTASSSFTTVTVYPVSSGGQVSGGSTICLGNSTGTLTLTGYNNNILRWQKRLNSGSWSDISHTLASYSETPAEPGSWEFRAVIGIGGCPEAFSVPTLVTVDALSTGGNVNSNNTVCSGQSSGVLTLSGHTGSVNRWQYSIAPFSAWIDIVNTTTFYTSGPLTQTSRFRAVVKNGACNEAYSAYAEITVPALPVVAFEGILTSQCINSTLYALSGGSPAGGTYSGPGVSGANFNASAAGAGIHTITYTYTDTYLCTVSETNTITVYNLPAVSFNGSLPNQCQDATSYLLSGGNPPGGTYSGPGVTAASFNASTAGPGLHTITYTFTDGNGCTGNASNSILVNPVPGVFSLSGTGSYCQGSGGLTISLNGSQTGISYQLLKNASPVGAPITGSGSSLSWSGMTQGTYTVIATNPATACFSTMNGSVVLTENILPQVFDVSGSGYYCYTGSGLTVSLSGSETGVSYQLEKDGAAEESPLAGTGLALHWPGKPAATYTVLATVLSSGCSQVMNTAAIITQDAQLQAFISPNPAYVVMGDNLELNANPSGGTGVFSSHSWTGAGSTYLTSTTVVDPVISVPTVGNYPITYTVTDNHTCTATASLSVVVTSLVQEPAIADEIRCGAGTLLMEATLGSGGDEVQFSLDGSTVAFTDNAAPYQLITPVVTVGPGILVYARTRNSTSSLSSTWVSATARAYAASVGGILSGSSNICLGQPGLLMQLSGQVSTINKWQKRVNNGSWTDISGTSDTYSETPVSAGTWDYRAEVQIPGCDAVYSATASTVVDALSAGGLLSGGSSSICLGSSTGTITLTANTGSPVSWRKRLNNQVWQTIPLTQLTYNEVPSAHGYWEYQAEVSNGSCSSAFSSIYGIMVDAPTIGGVTSGGTSLCPGISTPVLSVGAQTGTVVKWQKRLDAGNWIDIGNTTVTFAEIPSSSGTWDYRAVVQNGNCPPANAVYTTVIVFPESVGGLVSGSATICLGSSTGTLVLSGNNNNILRWQKRLDTGSWIDISNTASTFAEAPTAVGTWEYRAVTGISDCQQAYSLPASITVITPTVAGSVSGSAVVCQGQTSGLLTLTGHTGDVMKWQYAVSPFTAWITINNTGITYTSGALLQTTRFRAVVKNGPCFEEYSAFAEISVPSLPVVTFTGILTSQCVTSTSYTLTGGTPAGGTYSGTGVTGASFNASVAGVGTHTITYSYTDNYNCTVSAVNHINVLAIPLVVFNTTLTPQCLNSTTYLLTGGSPAGGSYSGPGVNGTNFNASSAGVGTHTITYSYINLQGCSNFNTNVIIVNDLPQVYVLSGAGSYCQGSGGLTVSLSGSQTGVNYTLYKNGSATGLVLQGTGNPLLWDNLTQGVYTVLATHTLTACSRQMSGSVTLTEYPLPALFTVGGSGSYCYAAPGKTVSLNGSQSGISYQLKKNGVNLGSPLTGTGLSLSWPEMTTGTYTVEATNVTSNCSRVMNGSAFIAQDPPLQAAITPDPAYVIAGNSISLNANPSGGTEFLFTHLWSGPGSPNLSSLTTVNPVFSSSVIGNYNLQYTVTDFHACTATDNLTVHVISQVAEPQMTSQVRCGTGTVIMEVGVGTGGDEVQFSLNGSTVISSDNSFPYQFETPVITAGNTLLVYARSRSSLSNLTSTWISATAYAFAGSVGGLVSGGATVCLGNPTPLLSLNNYAGNIVAWQKRNNGGSWMSVSNTAATYTEIPLLSGNWEYRAEIQIPGCASAFSTSTTVVVTPLSEGGTLVAGAPVICIGSSTGTISLTGQTGEVISWRKRWNNGVWQNIPNSSTTYSEIPAFAGNWDYQAEVMNGNCLSAYSSILTIQVDPATVVGNVSGNGIICPQVSTPLMSLSAYSGSILNWQKRWDSGNWTDIINTNSTFAEVPTASGTWEYRAVIQQGVCPPSGSAPATIVVLPESAGGHVSGGSTICLGNATGLLSLSGNNNDILRWQKRPDGGSWTDIINTGFTYSEIPLTAGSWEYRAVVGVGDCPEAYSIPALVVVTSPALGGNVSGSATVCSGQTSGLLTLSAYSGNIVKWQYAVSPFLSWIDIANTDASYISGLLTQTTRFRAVVKNGVCPEEYAAYAIITVPAPAVVSFGGTLSSQCISSTTYTLSGGSPAGGTYTGPGVNGVNFNAALAGTGTHTITYQYSDIYGCSATAVNSITVYPLPVVSFTGNIPAQCLSATTFSLSGGLPAGGTYSGPGVTGNNFSASAAGTGIHTISYSYSDIYGCASNAVNTVAVYPNPSLFILSGGGSYCQGSSGSGISLSGSQTGVNYQLLKNGAPVGPPQPGSGTGLSWPGLLPGVYTVVASNTTTACSSVMTGSITVTVNPLPTVFTLTGSGNYCAVGNGLTLTLSGSENNVSYQLKRNSLDVGSPLMGTGSSLSWPDLPSGVYTVVASNFLTGCSATMSGLAVIIKDPALTATILPDPAFATVGNNLNLNAYPSGGSAVFSAHQWSGDGAAWLSSASIANPVFNCAVAGNYNLVYTVTDSHGCTASDNLTVQVMSAVQEPVMSNQVRCGSGQVMMQAVIGLGGDLVEFSLNGNTVIFSDNTSPYQYYTPVIGAGNTLIVYARTKNSTSGISSTWVSATAYAYQTSVGGSVSGGTSICFADATPVLTLTGNIGNVISWQKRNNAGSWVSINNTNPTYAETPAAPGNWEYRAEVLISGCTPSFSTATTVIVNSPSAGGVLSGGDLSICLGSGTGTMYLTDYTGSILSWRKRFNNGVWQTLAFTGANYADIPTVAGTWEYQAMVKNGICPPAYSTSLAFLVEAVSQGGSLSPNASICPQLMTPVMTLIGYSGDIIRWQKRLGSANWIDIANTSPTYNEIPASGGTWEYRAVVQQGSCAPEYSTSAFIQVQPAVLGGQVSGSTSVCLGSSTGTLQLSGNTGTVIRWQKRIGTNPWSIISNSATSYAEIPSAAGTWQYRAVVSVANCAEEYSLPAVIVVSPVSVGGSVIGNATICPGQSSGLLSLTGNTGAVIKWQYAASPFTGWTDISNTNTTYSSGPLTVTTLFRAVVKNGTCEEIPSQAAEITVSPSPVVTYTGSIPVQCINAPPFSLSGGSPTGGSYNGPGVSGNSFNPANAGTGTHTVTYTYYSGAGCPGIASNTVSVVGLPTVTYTGTMLPACINALPIPLSGGSPAGGTYSGPGVSSNVFYPAVAGAAMHTVTYSYVDDYACSGSASNSIEVYPLPVLYVLTGNGSYCAGAAGLTVSLSGSQPGVGYQLYKDGLAFGAPLSGTGNSLSWNELQQGVYTVLALNAASGCSSVMSGNAVIIGNPLPQLFEVGGSGSYCYGANGKTITLNGSQAGSSYQLLKDGLIDGSPLPGTGSALSWPGKTSGSYTVVATVNATACARTMTAAAVITQDPQLSASITPGSTYVITGTDLPLLAVTAGGTGSFTSHLWTGSGASSLSDVSIVNPVFNSPSTGSKILTYTVTDSHGCSASSGISLQVTVPVAVPAMSNNIRCGNGSVLMTATPGTGGDQLQFSLDGMAVALTDDSPPYEYQTPSITAGNSLVVYARMRNSLSGFTSNWVTATAIAYPFPVGGSVSSDAGFCLGSATPLMTLSAYTGSITKWQKRFNEGAWVDIANTATTYTEIPTSAGTWQYRAEIQITGCSPEYSSMASMLVYAPSVGGTLSGGSSAICLGMNTGMISLSGQTGSVVSWRKRLNNTAWQTISNTLATFAETPSSVGTWDYQAVVQHENCNQAYSAIFTLVVQPVTMAGVVTGGGTVCAGTLSPTLVLGNNNGQVLNWQKRLGTGNWVNIANTASTYSEIPSSAGTWSYRAQVQNGSCASAYSVPATVVVNPAPAGGQLSGGGNICLGSSTGYLSLTSYTGTIQKWQRKLENGSWVDINNFTASYSAVPAATGMWYYRVVVTSGSCGTAYSTLAQVLVYAPSIGGMVSGNNTSCQGSSTGLLTLSGHTGSIMKWQKRLNGGNWTDILNTGASFSEVQLVAGSWEYRAQVQNGACSPEFSTPATVIVQSNTLGGVVSGGTAFCYGNPTTPLLLTAYNGSILKWQKRLNGGSWTDIIHTLPTYSETPSAPGTWEYRALVQNGTCQEQYAVATTVTVNPNPQLFQFSGPSFFCLGVNGVTLLLTGSETGVAYQLKKNGTDLGYPLQGNGQALGWTGMTAGTYSVSAAHTVTACQSQMPGTVTVQQMPLPQVFSVTVSGVDCGGLGGGMVLLASSELSIAYQLFRNNQPLLSPQYGNGQSVLWNNLPEGNYTVRAVNPGTTCSSEMNGTGTVGLAPLPQLFPVTGGGDACANGAGVPVALSGSQNGVSYLLLRDGQVVNGIGVAGNGQAIDFGQVHLAGTYQVIASNSLTGCSVLMDESVFVNLFESPEADAGPDQACLFGGGVVLSASVSGGTDPYSFLWIPAAGLDNPAVLNPLANPVDTTVYTLQVTDQHGCIGTDEVTISPFVPSGQSIVLGTVTYANTVSTPLHPIPVYLKNQAGVIQHQTTTNATGGFQFNAFPDDFYILTAGSSQAVGGINSTDALETIKHFVHSSTLTGIHLIAADVDASGFVNAVDALTIARFFVGLIPGFAAGPWAFEKKALIFNGSIYVMNLKGLCFGDVNGSFIPYAKNETELAFREEGKVPARPNGTVQLPVSADLPEIPAAVSLDMTFNPHVFRPTGISFPAGGEGWIWNITDDRIRISGVALNGLAPAGLNELAVIHGIAQHTQQGKWMKTLSGEIAGLDGSVMESSLSVPSPGFGSNAADPECSVYPNPATTRLTVSYSLAQAAEVQIEMTDASGRLVLSPGTTWSEQGIHHRVINLTGCKPGVYILKLRVSGQPGNWIWNEKIIVLPGTN